MVNFSTSFVENFGDSDILSRKTPLIVKGRMISIWRSNRLIIYWKDNDLIISNKGNTDQTRRIGWLDVRSVHSRQKILRMDVPLDP